MAFSQMHYINQNVLYLIIILCYSPFNDANKSRAGHTYSIQYKIGEIETIQQKMQRDE